MIDKLLEHIAPHPCSSCGKLGPLLCDNCKYDISNDMMSMCILCGCPANESGLCSICRAPYSRAWHIGERTDTLKDLIDGLKFERQRAAGRVLGALLHERISQLPPETTIIPVPTISSHIRQRGYDHAYLIARHLAELRHLRVQRAVSRTANSVQRGHNKKERITQANRAFALTSTSSILPQVPYLIIDDVVTTGATLAAVANVLRSAGAETIWVAAVARQPLD